VIRIPSSMSVVILGLLAVVSGMAFAAQDKYTVKVPNGLAFSDFRGYEDWKDVAVSQTETNLKVILANDVMMKAYQQGLPANGKIFPDGSKIVKIEWFFKKNPVSPYFVNVPDTLKAVDLIEKDTKRFPDTHGWAPFSKRRRVRLRVPYDGRGTGLHLHGAPEALNRLTV
jgi:hypothetical protein